MRKRFPKLASSIESIGEDLIEIDLLSMEKLEQTQMAPP
jgi:hypothetical protein